MCDNDAALYHSALEGLNRYEIIVSAQELLETLLPVPSSHKRLACRIVGV